MYPANQARAGVLERAIQVISRRDQRLQQTDVIRSLRFTVFAAQNQQHAAVLAARFFEPVTNPIASGDEGDAAPAVVWRLNPILFTRLPEVRALLGFDKLRL